MTKSRSEGRGSTRRGGRGTTPKKKSSIEDRLIHSMRQAVAIAKGKSRPAREYSLPRTARQAVVAEPKPYTGEAIAQLRERLQLSQAVFARALAKSPATVRSWEQGQRAPDAAANRMLEIVERHPFVIYEFIREGAVAKPVSERRTGKDRRAP